MVGFSDAQVPDVVLTIAMTVFANYFNYVHRTAVDFPNVGRI